MRSQIWLIFQVSHKTTDLNIWEARGLAESVS